MKKILLALVTTVAGVTITAPAAQAWQGDPFTACENTVVTWGVASANDVSPKLRASVTERVRNTLEEFTRASAGRYRFVEVGDVELRVEAMDPEWAEMAAPMMSFAGPPLVGNKYVDVTVLIAPNRPYVRGSSDLSIPFGPGWKVSGGYKWVQVAQESEPVRVRGSVFAELTVEQWQVKRVNRELIISRLLGWSLGVEVGAGATKKGLSAEGVAAVAEAAEKSCDLVRQNPGVSSALPNILGRENAFRGFDGIS